jgi:AraC-like DNA-binding protein
LLPSEPIATLPEASQTHPGLTVAGTIRTRQLFGGDIWMLHRDPVLLNRLRALPARVRSIPDWGSLASAYAGSAPARDLVVVDPYYEDIAAGPDPALARFLHAFPSAVVVAAVDSALSRIGDVRTLGEWGVAGIVVLDFDTSGYALRQRLEEARERSALYAVLQAIPDTLASDSRLLVEAALATASWGGSVRDMAQSLFLSERTLQRRTERARLPAPRSLLRWMRLLLAARLLDDPGRTVISAALAAGYASDASLHRNFRVSGLPSPATLRRTGALEGAVRHFLDRLNGGAGR